MATVAVVDGVKIMLYANEHPSPHFHAKFAEFHAVIDIDKLAIVRGSLPPHPRSQMRLSPGRPGGRQRCEAHLSKRWRNVGSDRSDERIATYRKRRGNHSWCPEDHLQGRL